MSGTIDRLEIRFAGYGGQGIALMGMLAGKAAVIHDGKHAVFTQAYGPEARGGASSANVIISSEPVDYPLVDHPQILVAMFQEAFDKFSPSVAPGGLVLIDPDLVKPGPGNWKLHAVPATKFAEEMGRRIVANIIMLGAFAAITGAVTPRGLEETIKTTLKPKIIDLNVKALARGVEAARGMAVAA